MEFIIAKPETLVNKRWLITRVKNRIKTVISENRGSLFVYVAYLRDMTALFSCQPTSSFFEIFNQLFSNQLMSLWDASPSFFYV